MQKGRVYKLTSPETDKIYIGSTFKTLHQRLIRHKQHYRAYLRGKHNYYTSYGRVQMAKFVMNNDLLNETVRLHTDGIVLTKELDFEKLKSNYQPKIEDKYHKKNIIWYNCIYNSENKDKEINEENE